MWHSSTHPYGKITPIIIKPKSAIGLFGYVYPLVTPSINLFISCPSCCSTKSLLNFDIDIGGYTKLHTHTLKTHLMYGWCYLSASSIFTNRCNFTVWDNEYYPTPININSPHLYMLFPALHFASQIYAQLFSIHHCVATSLTSSSKKEDVAIFFPQ